MERQERKKKKRKKYIAPLVHDVHELRAELVDILLLVYGQLRLVGNAGDSPGSLLHDAQWPRELVFQPDLLVTLFQ